MSELALFPASTMGSASASSDLHRAFDALHQMIYRRGGIRPVNAAIEELTKLLLLEIKVAEDPTCVVPGYGALSFVLDPDRIETTSEIDSVKAAFRHVVSLPAYAARLPGGTTQPIWPNDEPLRISRADVVAEALRLLRRQIEAAGRNHFDLIGTAFDIFLRGRYDHAGGLGTYLTPHTVATTLTEICLSDLDPIREPFEGPVIGDPCCGTGRFLIAAINQLDLALDDPLRHALLDRGLLGADQSPSSIAKARINLLLLGARHPNVFTVEDSLVDPHIRRFTGGLRLILTNPPFGDGKYDGAAAISRTAQTFPSVAGRRRIDPALAFVALCLDLLADGGRLGIILPDGVVDGPALRHAFLGSSATRLRDIAIEASVSLPTATFALGGTVARTSALIVRKQKSSRSHVFLARAEHVGYLKQGSGSAPDPKGDDLPAIAEAGTRFFTRSVRAVDAGIEFLSREPLAAVVHRPDVTSLDPSRVDPEAVAARRALRADGTRLREVMRPSKRRARPASGAVPFISVLHIDDLGGVAWHEAECYRPTTPGLEVQAGDLIVSLLNPRKLRAAVIPTDVPSAQCSSEFGVFATAGDPYEAMVLLHHPMVRAQLAPMGRGTSSSRRRVSEDDLLDLYAPAPSRMSLSRIAGELRAAHEQLRDASLATARALDAARSFATLLPDPPTAVPSGSRRPGG